MTRAMRWLNATCLQHTTAVYAHTMPFSLMKPGSFARAGACHHVMLPISCIVQGRSMPIFRGGPLRSG